MTASPEITLRPAQDDDASVLAGLASGTGERSVLEAALTSASVSAGGGLSAVAEREGGVVGHVVVARDGTAGVLAIAVAGQVRGQGIGRLLLEHAVAWARQAGLAALRLTVDGDNLRAQKLYLTAGFATVETNGPYVTMELQIS